MIKKLLPSLGTLIFMVASAFAGPCIPGTLQDYVNLGSTGCDVSGATFSPFLVLPGQSFAIPIDPSAIAVTPVGGAYNPGLQFGINVSADPGELFESFFRFTVTGQLMGASLLLGPGTATGDGQAIAVEELCADGAFGGNEPSGCSGIADTAITFRTESDAFLSDPKVLSGSFFDVFVDITIDGGLAGTASLDNITTQFDLAVTEPEPVPEPSTGILLAGGIALLGLLRRRKK